MKNYKFDGNVLSVERGSFLLEAEGDWLRVFVKEPKRGFVFKFGVDHIGSRNFFDAVAIFIEATKEIVEKENSNEKK